MHVHSRVQNLALLNRQETGTAEHRNKTGLLSYIILIALISGQYGEILHEHEEVFSESKERENTTHKCNVSA